MKNYLAITSPNKYADFDTLAEAQAHVFAHGGFAAATPGQYSEFFVIDMEAETVNFDQTAYDTTVAAKTKLAAIAELENQITLRMLREASFDSARTYPQGNPRVGKTAKQVIAEIDAAIETIRSS